MNENKPEEQGTLARGRATSTGVSAEEITWQPGVVIANLYEVKSRLGGGGMGEVWLVRHQKWNVDLAVKSPLPELVVEPQTRQMFIREAETWADLDKHLNIATCYYVRELGGLPRIFIDYVDGGNLGEWISQGKVSDWQTILRLAIEIASGMAHAHQNALVHRDLKPQNILLTKEGQVKLTDFGLVRRLGDKEILVGGADEAWKGGTLVKKVGVWQSMSMKGGALGTPAYMSPEQWTQAHKAGRETDIYSFGIILFEMVCGRKPYEIPDEYKDAIDELKISLYRQMHCEFPIPSPREYRADCPDSLIRVITRCLQKEAGKRYADFDSLREELISIYQEVAGTPYPHPEVDEIKQRADDLNNKGVSMLDLSRKEEAKKRFEVALKQDPHHLLVTYNSGLLKWREAEIADDEFIRQLEEANSSQTDQIYGKYLLGVVHMERADLESTRDCMKKAVESFPDNAEYQNALGLALFGLENYDESTSCFTQTVDLSPDNWRYRVNLATSLLKKGNKEEAKKQLADILSSPEAIFGLSSWLGIPLSQEPEAIIPALHQLQVPRAGLVKAFEAHEWRYGDVDSVCFSPDGGLALSGSRGEIKLWDIKSGECLRTFEGHEGLVKSVCFSPDGRYVLSGSGDKTVRLWDVESGKCLRTFWEHQEGVSSVSFSPDGRFVLSASYDKAMKLWDIETGECLRTFEGHKDSVYSVRFSPDGRVALSGSRDDTLKLWDIESGKCLRSFEGHRNSVNSVCFSPDGRLALSGSGAYPASGYDRTLKLWDIKSGVCLRTFEGHRSSVNSVCFSPDGRLALSGSGALSESSDTTLKLWDIKSGVCLRTFEGHISEVKSVCFSPDGRLALSGSADRTIKLWDISTIITISKTRLSSPPDYGLTVVTKVERDMELSSQVSNLLKDVNNFIQSQQYSCAYQIIQRIRSFPGYERSHEILELTANLGNQYGERKGLKDTWLLRTFEGHKGWINSVCLSPDGGFALSGSGDQTIKLWDIRSGKCLRTFEGGHFVCFSPDGGFALSGSADGTIKLWDIKSGECLRTFEGHEGSVKSVCFSPDGRYVLSGSGDKTIKLWDIKSGECLRTFKGVVSRVTFVCFSPDGRVALSGSGDDTLKLWDVKRGKCRRTFEGHERMHGEVSSVCFSPDGRLALSGSLDKTLKLWDVESGECLRTFEGHENWIKSVCFSLDGRFAISGSHDRTLKLWDIRSGKCLRTFEGHVSEVESVCFSPDGRFALSGSADKTLKLWELDWEWEFHR